VSRPSNALPRVVRHDGVQVYAARCWYCESDERTEWIELPTNMETLPDYATARAVCLGNLCADAHEFGPRKLQIDRLEAWRAREPERLAARLAELKAGAS
jgi:hypothetical protein